MKINAVLRSGFLHASMFALLAGGVVWPAMVVNVRADSKIVVPVDGYSARDIEAGDVPEAWGIAGGNLAVYDRFEGLQIIDRESGTVQLSLGLPEQYIDGYITSSGGVWAGFVAPDPDGESFWVGFTIDYPRHGYVADDRIYEVDLAGNWNLRGKLTGNFDIDFFGGNVYVTANPHANQSGFPPGNSIYLFDSSGAGNHDLIAEVNGNSVGLGIDSQGNIYHGSYNTKKMYRFAAEQVAAAIGPTNLTVADAETLFDTPGGCYDTDVDENDHVVFSTNPIYPAVGSRVMVWAEGGAADGSDALVEIAAGIDSYAWLTMIDVEGDALAPTGNAFATDYFGYEVAELTAERIPGDANLDGRVDDVDAAVLAANWGTTAAGWNGGDFDASGTVDQADAAMMAENWQKSTLDVLMSASESTSVPEASGLVLLLMGGVVLGVVLRSRKRLEVYRAEIR